MHDEIAGALAALMLCLGGCAGEAPVLLEPMEVLEGSLTWEVTFPDGDRCSYTRGYEAVEDRSAPWLCPECDTVWRADMVGLEGEDCYARVTSSTTPPAVEWFGRDDEGFYRATQLNVRLGRLGDAEADGDLLIVGHATEIEVPDGVAELRISGELTRSVLVGDPYHGWRTPSTHACGWEKVEAPPYRGDWTVAVGETVPDGWFRDRCDEPVRLHELAGRYLVIDLSASDCGPCQDMANGERAFVNGMTAQGIPVEVVTLMVPSLGALLTPTPQSLLEEWSTYFGLDSPVLADRGWGLFVAASSMGEFGYPTSILVGPDLEVLDVSVGFGSWQYHEDLIEAHAR